MTRFEEIVSWFTHSQLDLSYFMFSLIFVTLPIMYRYYYNKEYGYFLLYIGVMALGFWACIGVVDANP
jgi:hypothetical protein